MTAVVWCWACGSYLGVRLALCELELLLQQLDVLAADAGVGLVLLQQLQVCRHLVLLLLLQVEPLLLPRRLLLQRSVLGEDLAAAVGERARRTRVTVASLESRERDGLHCPLVALGGAFGVAPPTRRERKIARARRSNNG